MKKSKKTLFSARIMERAINCGAHIAKTGDTMRQTAKVVGCSKSTVLIDINDRLILIDNNLYYEARKKIEINLAERHLRGGESTKKIHESKYKEVD